MSDANSSFDELLLKELRKQFPGLSDTYLAANGEALLMELKRRRESLSKDLTVGIPDRITDDLFEPKGQPDPKPKRKSKRTTVNAASQAGQIGDQGIPNQGVLRVANLLTAVAELIQDEHIANTVTGALLVLQQGPGESSILFTLPFNLLEAIGALHYYEDKMLSGSLPSPSSTPPLNPDTE